LIARRRRFIIDTNTFVSAILNRSSIPAQVVEKALRSGDFLGSIDTWQELEDVLMRDKFERYQPAENRLRYLEYLTGTVEMVSVLTKVSVCRDPKDAKFLELAIDGHADMIITGDNDLLTLHPFRGIHIITPADCLAL
jgi:uncharacterized protein